MELGNESPLVSMFQKQQAANDLQKAREVYNAILEKGKQLGLSRMSVMFLMYWVSTSVTPECLSRMCLRLLT